MWNGNWQAQWKLDPRRREECSQRLQAVADRFSFDLALKTAKPPVIHGENGVSQKAEGAGPRFALHFIDAPRDQRRDRPRRADVRRSKGRAGWITSSSRTNSRPTRADGIGSACSFRRWIRNHAVPVAPQGRNARSIFRWHLYRSTRPINAFIRERLFARAGEDLGQPKLRRPLSHRMEHSSSFSRSQRPAHHSLATAGTRGQDTRRTHLLGGFHPGERIEEGPRAPGPRLSGNDRLCRTGAHVNSGAGNSVADYFSERGPFLAVELDQK